MGKIEKVIEAKLSPDDKWMLSMARGASALMSERLVTLAGAVMVELDGDEAVHWYISTIAGTGMVIFPLAGLSVSQPDAEPSFSLACELMRKIAAENGAKIVPHPDWVRQIDAAKILQIDPTRVRLAVQANQLHQWVDPREANPQRARRVWKPDVEEWAGLREKIGAEGGEDRQAFRKKLY